MRAFHCFFRRFGWASFALVLATMPAPQLWGVVVSTTTGNTQRPQIDPGWDNVGTLRGSTAVYLGDRWVITAAHVGLGTVRFSERGTFEPEPGTMVQLMNPPGKGLSPQTDLVMFRLVDDPALPPLRIASDAPEVGTSVIVIGNGKNREQAPTYWAVDRQSSRWIWEESDPPGDFHGFKTRSDNSLRWGTNLIEEDETFYREGDDDITTRVETVGDVVVLITEFDSTDGAGDASVRGPDGRPDTDFEAQGVINDSGGALFAPAGAGWELAGLIVAVDGHRDQPSVTRTPIFGNLTFYADLATYGSQINDRFVYGDFDEDGQLTAQDLDAMAHAVRFGEYLPSFDLNRDSALDGDDRRFLVEQVLGSSFGDANLDGRFDSTDLIQVLQAGEYEDDELLNSTWETGDWNGDLEFGSSDLIAAVQSGRFELPREPVAERLRSAGGQMVPEPSALGVCYLAAVALITLARGRQRVSRESR